MFYPKYWGLERCENEEEELNPKIESLNFFAICFGFLPQLPVLIPFTPQSPCMNLLPLKEIQK